MDVCRLPSVSAKHCGLTLIGALLVFSPLLEGGTTHLATMVIRLLILATLSLYGVKVMAAKQWAPVRLPIDQPVLLFFGVVALVTVLSPYTNQSVQWLMILLSYAILLYVLVALVEEWQDLAVLSAVVVGVGTVEALWAIAAYTSDQSSRPSGSFFNPNFLGGYLAVCAVFVLAYLIFWKPPASEGSWRFYRLAAGSLCIVLVTGLVLTGSRGGALAWVVGTALVISVRFGSRGLIGLVLLVGLAVALPSPMRDRVVAEHMHNPMAYTRWSMWENGFQQMYDYPWGIGLGLYQYTYPLYAIPIEEGIVRYEKVAITPHNEYVQLGVETGVLGLCLFVWGVGLVLRESAVLLSKQLDSGHRALVVGMCAGTAVILTQAGVDSNLHEPALAILLILCAGGIMKGRMLLADGEPRRTDIAIQRTALWAACGAAVIALSVAQVIRIGMAYHLYDSGADLVKQQRYSEAIEKFQQAVLLDGGKSLYHNSLAAAHFQLYHQAGDLAMFQASMTELQTAIRLNPLDGRLESLLGLVSATRGRQEVKTDQGRQWLEQSAVAYERAAERQPFSYAYRWELGRIMLALGHAEVAEQHWRKVVELEPNYLPAREALVRLYVESQRKETASLEYQEILVRRQQWSGRAVSQLERSFLQVDDAALAALLEGTRSAT